MIFPCSAFSTLGKSIGVRHTALPNASPQLRVACTVFAQLCGPKANETEVGAVLFTKNGEGRNLTLFCVQAIQCHVGIVKIDSSHCRKSNHCDIIVFYLVKGTHVEFY